MESMVYVTMQQMVGFANVTQGLLVITALLVRNSSRRFSKTKMSHFFDCVKSDSLIFDSLMISHFQHYLALEISPEIDYCAGDPCGPGGVCYNLTSQYLCTCFPGFAGDECDTGFRFSFLCFRF